MRILAIETSCDETGVAVIEDGRRIRANVIATQLAHQATGGIVPEVAAREHLRAIDPITDTALRDAGITLREVDAVGATVGPGLIGCLLVGANYGRGLALAAGLPFIGVNHLEGHVYAAWLMDPGQDEIVEPVRRHVAVQLDRPLFGRDARRELFGERAQALQSCRRVRRTGKTDTGYAYHQPTRHGLLRRPPRQFRLHPEI